jgi:coenzyme F420-reducing hydrogenase alpha subunit
VNQSAINFISGHGTSEIISPEPDKVLVCYADINTITTKKKWRYATQTAAKKKEYAENHKRARAKEKGAYKEIVPKQAEETKWLKTLVTELERTTVLLTQPAPVTARSTYLKSYILKEHARLSSKLKRKKRNEKKQQAILQHAAKSVELLRTEDELKKLMQHLHRNSGNSRNKRKLFKQK